MITQRQSLFRVALSVASFLLVFFSVIHSSFAAQARAAQAPAPKYIFLFLADGAGIPHMEITRQYNRVVHNEGLVITDKIMKEGSLGLITTHAADSLSTDSAAAATALASGCKAKIGAIGMCADGTVPKTALEIPNGKRIVAGPSTKR